MREENALVSNRVDVDILGERYTIRGDADPGYISEVASLVDDRLRELRTGYRGMTKSKLAILVAINLADELLQERNRLHSPEMEEITLRTRQMISMLDQGLVGDEWDD